MHRQGLQRHPLGPQLQSGLVHHDEVGAPQHPAGPGAGLEGAHLAAVHHLHGVIGPAHALQERLEQEVRTFMRVRVVLHDGHLQGAQGFEEGRRGVPLIHQHDGRPCLQGLWQGGMQFLPQVDGLAGQGLIQKGVGATPHPPGPVIPGDGDAGEAAQGPPGLLEGKGPGHMAQSKTQVCVDAKDQKGGHGGESLPFPALPGEGEPNRPVRNLGKSNSLSTPVRDRGGLRRSPAGGAR